jgi:hemoglobin/transferrin/lactoferrin receptor protein
MIKRIEILKGANSAIYGSRALGGVANVITKTPEDYLGDDRRQAVYLTSNYRSANDLFRESATFAFREEGIRFLLQNSKFDATDNTSFTKNSWDNREELDFGQFHGNNVWFTSIYELSGQYEISFDFQNFYQRDTSPANPQLDTGTRVKREMIKNSYKISLGEKDPLPENGLRLLAYYHDTRINENALDGLGKSQNRKDDLNFDTFGCEFIYGDFFEAFLLKNDFRAGVEYVHDKTKNNRDILGRTTKITAYPDGKSDSLGAFIENEILFDSFSYIIAARWDGSRVSSEDGSRSDSRLNPKLTIKADLCDEIMVFSNYSHGFRMPTIAELFSFGTFYNFNMGGFNRVGIFNPNDNLGPENSEYVDMGIKALFEKCSFDISGFYSDIDDFIEPVLVSQTIAFPNWTDRYQFQNISEVKTYGWEASSSFSFNDYLDIFGNYSKTVTKNKNTGEFLLTVPPGKWVFKADAHSKNRKLWITATVLVYEEWDHIPYPTDNNVNTGGYTLLNLNAGMRMERFNDLEIYLGVDNVLDKPHRKHNTFLPGESVSINAGVSLSF